MAKKAAAKKAPKQAAAPKPHERKKKPSEAERLEKGIRLVANYLEQRDGMDPQMALDVANGLGPDELNALIEEANTAVLSDTKKMLAVVSGADKGNGKGATLAATAEPEKVFPDFLTIPALAEYEAEDKATFAELVVAAASNARDKNVAEKRYKSYKARIMVIMDEAKTKLASCVGIKLERYKGESNHILDPLKLIEKGVSIDIINQCYVWTEYEDVRITAPKGVV